MHRVSNPGAFKTAPRHPRVLNKAKTLRFTGLSELRLIGLFDASFSIATAGNCSLPAVTGIRLPVIPLLPRIALESSETPKRSCFAPVFWPVSC